MGGHGGRRTKKGRQRPCPLLDPRLAAAAQRSRHREIYGGGGGRRRSQRQSSIPRVGARRLPLAVALFLHAVAPSTVHRGGRRRLNRMRKRSTARRRLSATDAGSPAHRAAVVGRRLMSDHTRTFPTITLSPATPLSSLASADPGESDLFRHCRPQIRRHRDPPLLITGHLNQQQKQTHGRMRCSSSNQGGR
nr:unnamed protein product [Digitaria exilis]